MRKRSKFQNRRRQSRASVVLDFLLWPHPFKGFDITLSIIYHIIYYLIFLFDDIWTISTVGIKPYQSNYCACADYRYDGYWDRARRCLWKFDGNIDWLCRCFYFILDLRNINLVDLYFVLCYLLECFLFYSRYVIQVLCNIFQDLRWFLKITLDDSLYFWCTINFIRFRFKSVITF